MRIVILVRRLVIISFGVLVAVALVVQMAAAEPAPPATGAVLTHKQVLQIALREARHSEDPHPTRIEMATGSLKEANSVMDPRSRLGSPASGKERVDLIVMHGYFHINAPHPHGSHIAPGKVMELIIGAHTGFVQGRSLGNNVPVPLSHLGRVIRLR